jgi:tetratricopeptide (TPR) repeat protein
MAQFRSPIRRVLASSVVVLAVVAVVGIVRALTLGSVAWALVAIAACVAAALVGVFAATLGAGSQEEQSGATDVTAAQTAAATRKDQAPAGEKDATPSAAAKAEAQSNDALAAQAPRSSHPDDNADATEAADATDVAEPATQTVEVVPAESSPQAPAESQLDFESVAQRLQASADPMDELKLVVGDIRTRMAQVDGESGSQAQATLSPSGIERFFARVLVEAGLFEKDVKLPRIAVTRSSRTGTLRLRVQDEQLSYLARLRVLKLEAALAAAQRACAYFEDPQSATVEDCYRLMQSLANSICAQSAPIDQPLDLEAGEVPDGEWAVRRSIATAIESLQLPYRLEQHFRTNVADGNVVFQVALTPEQVFPSSMYVDGIGLVHSSREMRRKVASAYAQRLAILLAATAFRSSRRIKHAWVVGTVDNATTHRCYLCVDFDRWRFARLDLAHVDDLRRAMRPFVPNMRVEDGILRPVEQTADLDEARFSPAWRFMPVELSSRRLPKEAAAALGTQSVSGLGIEEASDRQIVAGNILLHLADAGEKDATQRNVRTVLDFTRDDPDPTVRDAGERLVKSMVSGTSPTDPEAIGPERVFGDPLSRAAERGRDLLSKRDAAGAVAVLEPVLDHLDRTGAYADGKGVVWRYFGSYVDRALYNRKYASDGRALLLAPDSYFAALFYASVAQVMLHHPQRALTHARRLVELAPLDNHAVLQLVRCLEECGSMDEAQEVLTGFLRDAHDPESIGLGYYRMASFMWNKGNLLAAQACYQSAMSFMPSITPIVVMEVAGLQQPQVTQVAGTDAQDAQDAQSPADDASGDAGEKDDAPDAQAPADAQSAQVLGSPAQQGAIRPLTQPLSQEEIEATLGYHDIPVAPTPQVSQTVMECTRASVDAEVFPVARNFVNVLAAFDQDDVTLDVMDSLGSEPDQ